MYREPESTHFEPSADAKTFGMLAHLASFGGIILPFGGHIIGPLVIWLLKRDTEPFVDHHGKEALNFQISLTLYALISGILTFILIGIVGLIIIMVVDIVLTIIAALRANSGEYYSYPITIRFIK